jgi:hypothetical protein
MKNETTSFPRGASTKLPFPYSDIFPVVHAIKTDSVNRGVRTRAGFLERPGTRGHSENPPSRSPQAALLIANRACMKGDNIPNSQSLLEAGYCLSVLEVARIPACRSDDTDR